MTLERFPRRTLRGDRVIHRVHRTAKGCWWFSADGSGPFDPVGTTCGACYFAEQPVGAWIEVFRKRMLLAEVEITERSLSSVQVGRNLRLADLTSRRALSFGVTATLGASEDYGPSQRFAAEAIEAGFDGVRYLAGHDPAQQLFSAALFAPAGPPIPGGPDWPENAAPIPDELVVDARRLFGYQVLPTP